MRHDVVVNELTADDLRDALYAVDDEPPMDIQTAASEPVM